MAAQSDSMPTQSAVDSSCDIPRSASPIFVRCVNTQIRTVRARPIATTRIRCQSTLTPAISTPPRTNGGRLKS